MKKYIAILKRWEDILPDLDYRSVEAMYSLMDEQIEITLTVGRCEYYKSLSGQIGYYYENDYYSLQSIYPMVFPMMHGRKHNIRKEWIEHSEELKEYDQMNKSTAVEYLKEHPEWKI